MPTAESRGMERAAVDGILKFLWRMTASVSDQLLI
jgi:hypothetical protein